MWLMATARKMNITKTLIPMHIVILLVPPLAQAELMVGESLEWIVADSDLIVTGSITKVEVFEDERKVSLEEATVQVNETIKGRTTEPLLFLVRCVGINEKPSKWQEEGVELLLFLVKSSRYEALDPEYRKSDFALRLWGAELSFVRLNNRPQTGLFTMDFDVLEKRNDILKAVRSAANCRPTSLPPEHRVEVPFDSEVFRTLYSGSSVRLIVPADERLETRARHWLKSEDPETRQQGASAIRYFESPANTELLRPLLSDNAFMTTTRNEVSTQVYYVRAAAFETLSEWDVDVQKPVIEVPVNAVETNDVPVPETSVTGAGEHTATSWREWYNGLWKPSWTPAPQTIGLIWQILYPIIIVTFGFVFVQAFRRKVPWLVAVPFAINLVANLIFTPIQFGMRNLPLAAVDILIVWATIIWIMVVIWKHYRWVSVAQAPYFVWVSIATVLQLSITWMNWGR
jgi:tryptophan-rich sensory protein